MMKGKKRTFTGIKRAAAKELSLFSKIEKRTPQKPPHRRSVGEPLSFLLRAPGPSLIKCTRCEQEFKAPVLYDVLKPPMKGYRYTRDDRMEQLGDNVRANRTPMKATLLPFWRRNDILVSVIEYEFAGISESLSMAATQQNQRFQQESPRRSMRRSPRQPSLRGRP